MTFDYIFGDPDDQPAHPESDIHADLPLVPVPDEPAEDVPTAEESAEDAPEQDDVDEPADGSSDEPSDEPSDDADDESDEDVEGDASEVAALIAGMPGVAGAFDEDGAFAFLPSGVGIEDSGSETDIEAPAAEEPSSESESESAEQPDLFSVLAADAADDGEPVSEAAEEPAEVPATEAEAAEPEPQQPRRRFFATAEWARPQQPAAEPSSEDAPVESATAESASPEGEPTESATQAAPAESASEPVPTVLPQPVVPEPSDGFVMPAIDPATAAALGLSDDVPLDATRPWVPEEPAQRPASAAATVDDPLVGRRRRTLLPRWFWPALAVAAVLIGIATFAAIRISQSSLVEVPQLVGLTAAQAQARLEAKGLRGVTTDSRYSSSVAKGGILGQDPKPGSKVKRGSRIALIVSVGSETVQMPDVIGMSLTDAQRVLSSLGLQVRIERVSSEDATPDVVLSSIPSPGVSISTSDIVRLAAAGSVETSSGSLLPYKLDGTTFAIDPSPMTSGTADAPMEVARRLRALLEASGARVIVTRSVNDTDTSAGARALRAQEGSPTAIVGLDVPLTGRSGLGVMQIVSTRSAQSNYAGSLKLAQTLMDTLQRSDERPQTLTPVDDVVAFTGPAPGVRVQLGTSGAAGDRLALTDPDRDDAIARGIYRALGRLYGKQ